METACRLADNITASTAGFILQNLSEIITLYLFLPTGQFPGINQPEASCSHQFEKSAANVDSSFLLMWSTIIAVCFITFVDLYSAKSSYNC